MRPIGIGALPVYDLALDYLRRDSANLKLQLAELKEEIASQEKTADEVEKLREKAEILEIQSKINLPSVRWKARNGLGTGYKSHGVSHG